MGAARKTELSDTQWMSLIAASRELGETRFRVMTRALKGEVEFVHVAGRTLISRASVERLLAERVAV